MKSLPDNLVAYKQTPEFNQHSVPQGLLNKHSTKEGVWGKIVVLEGRLLYTIPVEVSEAEQIILDENTFGVVEPMVLHSVKPLGDVRFFVAFYRKVE